MPEQHAMEQLRVPSDVDGKAPMGFESEKLQTERERLELDKRRAESDLKFLNRNFGAVVTLAVAIATIFFSYVQWHVAQISKDKEIQLAREQKDKELAILTIHNDREWNLSVARFVVEHSKEIFSGNNQQRDRVVKLVRATFPPSIAIALFGNFESIPGTSESKQTWQKARTELLKSTNAHVHGGIADVITGKPLAGVSVTFVDNVSSFVARSVTGPSGEYGLDLQASPSGSTYRVVGEHPKYITRNDFVPIRPGDTVVEFNLYPRERP